jgi:hypothetical protein
MPAPQFGDYSSWENQSRFKVQAVPQDVFEYPGGTRRFKTTGLDTLNKPTKNLSQDSRCPSWDSDQASPEYESWGLPLFQHALATGTTLALFTQKKNATFRQEVITGRKSHKGARYQDILTDWLTDRQP